MAQTVSLLEATYIHGQGIGRTTESNLWEAGARTWEAYLSVPDSHWPLSLHQRTLLTPLVKESLQHLKDENFRWFANKLPVGEHWRAVPSFGHRLAFVDIETNGGMNANDITLIGVYDGWQMRQYIKGKNLQDFPESLEDAAMLVTFYGTGFDLPFIQRAFPKLEMPQMHVDLCYVLKKCGYKGGLKSIEHQLGISRSNATNGLSGLDAVRLWSEYRAGRAKSLEILLEYNAEDVKNMSDLLAIAYKKMVTKTLME